MPASGNDASRRATTSSTNCRVASCLVSILEGVFLCVPLVVELALCNSWQVLLHSRRMGPSVVRREVRARMVVSTCGFTAV